MVLNSGDKNADPKGKWTHGDFLHFELTKPGENVKRGDEKTVCSPPLPNIIVYYGFCMTSPLIIIVVFYSVFFIALWGRACGKG